MRLSVHKIILCYYDGKKSEKKAPRKKLIPPNNKKEIKTFIEYTVTKKTRRQKKSDS